MKRILLPLLVLAAILVTSCSSERAEHRLLDAIPSTASSVTFFDLDRLAREGVDVASLSRLPMPLHSGTRAFVTLADGTSLQLSDLPPVDSLAAAGYILEGAADEPLTTYTNSADGSTAILDTRRSVAYYSVLGSSRALSTVSDVAAAAEKLSFGSNKGLADYFDRSAGHSAIYGSLSMNLLGGEKTQSDDPQGSRWLAFDVKQESGVADLSVNMMQADGTPVEPRGLQDIDTDFLRYVPSSMNLVAAVGLTPEIDWDAAARLVSLAADRETSALFAIAAPYLKAIDGTVAVATSIDTTANYSSFFVMAHMEREKIRDLMSQIGTLSAMAGASSTTISDTQVKLTVPSLPFPVYAGEVDGNFAVASFPLDGRAENSLATTFDGHEAAAVFSIDNPSLASQLIDGIQAVDARMNLDDAEACLRLSFPGSAESPLAIIAGRLSR